MFEPSKGEKILIAIGVWGSNAWRINFYILRCCGWQ